MKPPYVITPRILQLVSAISVSLGEVNAYHLQKTSPTLRKQHKIKTIHSSLQIEGNTLTEEQISAIIEDKRVIGPKKDIMEVVNAIKVYDRLLKYAPYSERSFLQAHRELMKGLLDFPGRYRSRGVGIVKGAKVTHLAPPASNVPHLMQQLFDYVKRDEDLMLIKSCVFHYEMEFIHPFADGNGRMGRLWQSVLLVQEYPVFEFLPFETLIAQQQSTYYKALAASDKAGNSTQFIEYMLEIIDQSLKILLKHNNSILKDIDRLDYFFSLGKKEFSRKDYLEFFKTISVYFSLFG
jgi:Fic family protein